ncbi:MAG: SpoIVB peptidase S55 [Planctomycetota bacterium]|nr:MAG: SpoIVB peptidase S55 [Planctomycetota bacterium]
MKTRTCSLLLVAPFTFALTLTFQIQNSPAKGEPKPESYWSVDEVRAGMKGYGRTVMKGTKIETFEAEVLGVLKNTSPGRDMVLCRLSGLNLDKTGVVAGMSGSPIYLDGRLLGAVAYAWAFGKEPIAGITPFSQMHGFVEAYEHRDTAEQAKPSRVGLRAPVDAGGRSYDTVTVSEKWDATAATAADDLCMVPLQTPLAATGFTQHSLELLRQRCRAAGVLPMQGGGATATIATQEKNTPLQPGSPLAVAMITGDFDLSGIGTVTHVEGNRVYGWGHPYFGLGACEFPLMTGYIHTIYPRQTVSFKMGSPLRTVGVINADVSTGIAGWLERKPDLIPVRMTVRCSPGDSTRVFNVQIVRQRSLLATLLYTALTNSVDMEGDLPEELTAELQAKVEVEGHEPLIIKDVFSGSSYSGGRAPQSLYNLVSTLINILAYNTYKPLRINRIDCETRIEAGRRTAEIDAVELDSETYAPGDTIRAAVFVRPYKGLRQRVPLLLQLPADLPEGHYTATVCDDLTNARYEMRENPNLNNPHDLDQVFESLRVQTAAKRNNLVLRVATQAVGVALDGKALPDLPPSMVQILGTSRRTGAQTMGGAVVARRSTTWVVQGSESVRFVVDKNKKVLGD